MKRQSGDGDVPDRFRPRSLSEALGNAVSAIPRVADRAIYGDGASQLPPVPRAKPTPGTPGYTGDAGRGLPPIERMDVNTIQRLLADPLAAQQIEADPALLQRLRARLAVLRGGA